MISAVLLLPRSNKQLHVRSLSDWGKYKVLFDDERFIRMTFWLSNSAAFSQSNWGKDGDWTEEWILLREEIYSERNLAHEQLKWTGKLTKEGM